MKKKEKKSAVQLQYPCQWLYKVVGADREKLNQALLDTVSNDSCRITYSSSSRTGRYHCLNLEVTVQNEDERNSIYQTLKAHPLVKIIL
jgi:putative lipoic acid-binding regulatory protein